MKKTSILMMFSTLQVMNSSFSQSDTILPRQLVEGIFNQEVQGFQQRQKNTDKINEINNQQLIKKNDNQSNIIEPEAISLINQENTEEQNCIEFQKINVHEIESTDFSQKISNQLATNLNKKIKKDSCLTTGKIQNLLQESQKELIRLGLITSKIFVRSAKKMKNQVNFILYGF